MSTPTQEHLDDEQPEQSIDMLVATALDTGDPEAIGLIYQRLLSHMGRLAHRFTTEESTAEELALVATERVLTKGIYGDSYGIRKSFPAWSGRVGINAMLDFARRQVRQKTTPTDDETVFEKHALLTQNPEELATDGFDELLRPVWLDPEIRKTLILSLKHDLSNAEIADALNIPPTTVRTRIHRGIQHIRKHYNVHSTTRYNDLQSNVDDVGIVRKLS